MHQFPFKTEPFIATIARMLVGLGATREIAILANAEATVNCVEHDNWDGGTYYHQLILAVPVWLMRSLDVEDIYECQGTIFQQCELLLEAHHWDHMREVIISPKVETNDNWRENAKEWLAGLNLSNQGRVRSDTIASRVCDGLLFRSQPEINLYKALKSLGVTFAPLPVFIRGGEDYKRIEPDFVIIQDGIVLIVEVDGDTTHQETPVEAHNRTTMLLHEGTFLERVSASECRTPELAKQCGRKILDVIRKIKSSR